MKLLAPAKINLFLEIVNRRADGYHNIDTIFQAVSLYDKITLVPAKKDLSFECSCPGIPDDERNLAFKSAVLLKDRLGVTSGANIKLEKNIPAGAGLGGGSSDAAAVIKGLLALWKRRMPRKELIKFASGIGADVPFFLFGGCAAARGIGEKIEKIKGVKPCWYILIHPRLSVSTKLVYNKLKFPLTKKQKSIKMKLLLGSGYKADAWSKHIYNRLEQSVLLRYPEIRRIKSVLGELGLKGAMSGSGSSVFAPAGSKKEGEEVRSKLKKYSWDAWVVKSVS